MFHKVSKQVLSVLLIATMLIPNVLPVQAEDVQIMEETTEQPTEDVSETVTNAEESNTEVSDTEEKPQVEEPPVEQKDTTFTVSLSQPEHGTLVFQPTEEPVKADAENPMKAMEDAIKQIEDQSKIREKEYQLDEEVQLQVASDKGYELVKIEAKATDTGELIQELTCEPDGTFQITMPEANVTISATFAPFKESDDKMLDEPSLDKLIDERAVNNKNIGLNVGATVWYGAYNTNYFTTNEGFYAYCLEPKHATPRGGNYSTSLITNSYVRKAAYYSYGGPGYQKYKAKFGNIGDGSHQYEYCYSHVVVSYVYAKYYLGSNAEANNAFLGLSASTKNALIRVANNMLSMEDPNSGYACYYMNTSWGNGNGRTQAMLCQTYNDGTLSLKKSSSCPSVSANNKQYSLAGAQYGVYTNSGCTNRVGTLTTDANGNSNTLTLPGGTYYAKELTAPKGFELDTKVHSVSVVNCQHKTLNVQDSPINDPAVIRINKIDAKTGNSAQGSASLAGAQFEICYYDDYYSENNLPNTPTRKWVIETKEIINSKGQKVYQALLTKNYKVSGDEFYYFGNQVSIPKGTITIKEVKAPEGYNNDLKLTDANGKGGKSLYLAQIKNKGDLSAITGGSVFKGEDTIIRGDVTFTKTHGKTGQPMANIPFKITNRQTGESHTVYTDENGYFSSKSSYIPHSSNTNREQAKSGLWFGDVSKVDDSVGALPYGKYNIKELSCAANKSMKLFEGAFTVRENNTVFDLGNIVNHTIEISTKVENGRFENLGMMDKTSIVDNVYVKGLTTGYVEITLINKDTGEVIKNKNGQVIKGGAAITAVSGKNHDAEGKPSVVIDNETLKTLRGKTIVCCATLYEINGGQPDYSRVYAVHDDLNDINETLAYAEVETELVDKETGRHETLYKNKADTILKDSVKIKNIKGKTSQNHSIRVVGTLVNESGTPVTDKNGNQVKAEHTNNYVSWSQPEYACELEYTLPAEITQKYEGKTLHSFVEVYVDGSLFTYEKDTKNIKQTISIPMITNTQTDKDNLVSTDTGLTDVVELKGLIQGNEYTIEGNIVDKQTGNIISVDGKPLIEKVTFTAEGSTETRKVHFTFEPDKLRGKGYVVFEYLNFKDAKQTSHNDFQEITNGVHAIGDSFKEAAKDIFGIGTEEPSLIEKQLSKAKKSITKVTDKLGKVMEESTSQPEGAYKDSLGRTIIYGFNGYNEATNEAYQEIPLPVTQKSQIEEILPLSLPIQTGQNEEFMPVKWVCDEEVNATDFDEYTFFPQWSDEYVLSTEFQKKYDNFELSIPFITIRIIRDKQSLEAIEQAKEIQSSLDEVLGMIGNASYKEVRDTLLNSPDFYSVFALVGVEGRKSFYESLTPEEIREFEQILRYKYAEILPEKGAKREQVVVIAANGECYLEILPYLQNTEPSNTLSLLGYENADESSFYEQLSAEKGINVAEKIQALQQASDKESYKVAFCNAYGHEGPNNDIKQTKATYVAYGQGNWAGPGPSYFRCVTEIWDEGDTGSGHKLDYRRWIEVKEGSSFNGTIVDTNWNPKRVSLYGSGQYYGLASDRYTIAYGQTLYGGESLASYTRSNGTFYESKGAKCNYTVPYNKFTMTYDGNGGLWNGQTSWSTQIQYNSNFTTEQNFYTRTGYHFTGWNTSPGGGGANYVPGATYKWAWNYNVTVYAQWAPNTYTVRYHENGALDGDTRDSIHTYDTTSNLNRNGYTRDGYQFMGWSTSPTGGVQYADGASIRNLTSTNGDVIHLYAVWSKKNSFLVQADINGNITNNTIGYFTYDVYINGSQWQNDITAYNWTFLSGTNYQISDIRPLNGVTVNGGASGTIYSDTVVKLTARTTYTIQYDGNGATSGSTATSTHTYLSPKSLTRNGYQKTGYIFDGWNTKADGTGTYYGDGDVVQNLTSERAGVIQLYAQWIDPNKSNRHNSLQNEKQSFYVPKIQKTVLVDNATGDKYFSPTGSGTFKDTVTYSGLSAHINYRLDGELVDKETKQVVARASKTFTSSSKDGGTGSVDVVFNVDKSKFAGKTLVAYETLYGDVNNYGKPTGTMTKLTEEKNLDNKDQTITCMNITTEARDKLTKTKLMKPNKQAVVEDIVTYRGAVNGQKYRLEAVLMDKYKEEPVKHANGNPVTGALDFTASSSNGSVTVELPFDSTITHAGQYVVFEKLYGYVNGQKTLLTSHEDLHDANQTFNVIGLETTIYSNDSMTNVAYPSSNLSISDIITYTGLEAGKQYTAEWQLCDVDTGNIYTDASGNKILKSHDFTPNAQDGEFTITTNFNASKAAGKKLSAITKIKYNGTVVMTHNTDLTDKLETLHFPKLETKAIDTLTKNQEAMAYLKTSITDTVTYSNVQAGMGHILKTSLVDKNTGNVLTDNDGNPLRWEKEFKPEGTSGKMDIVMNFDGRNLLHKKAVVFQELWMGNKKVADHCDLNAASQTVNFSSAGEGRCGVTKRIKASDFHKEHGTPTFVFTLTGKDLTGKSHVYHQSVTFTEEYVEKHTLPDGYVYMDAFFEKIPSGTYVMTEETTGRYYLESVMPGKMNVTVQNNCQATYKIIGTETKTQYPTALFTNHKYEWADNSDSASVVNVIKKQEK